MTDVAAADLANFRKQFGGSVVEPADAGYDAARSIWNGAIDRRPAVIAQCVTPGHVSDAVKFAREAGLELSVRGGGHNFSGSALVEGGLTVDLTRMRGIEVDPGTKRARCGGGVIWGEYDAATQAHGLGSPGGFITHTGVAGLTLGGGMGWLTRRAGLAADNLTGVELVTASGDVVQASAEENADLFWAVRGGGGNFGVVTTFEFALQEVGLLNLQLYFWSLEDGADVLTAADAFERDLPDDVTVFVGGINAPPEPFVPEQYQLRPGYAMIVVGTGAPEAHQAALAPVKAMFPQPLFEFATPIPYPALQQMFDPSAPWGILGYEKAVHLQTMTRPAAEVIAEHMPRKASPLSFMPCFLLGGAYSRVPEDATAFGGTRSTRWVVNIAAVAPTPDLLEADTQWVRAMWSALVPHSEGIGSYVNFMTDFEEDRVRASYGAEKYARLSRVKAQWDPDNMFHLNANIRPAQG